MTHRHAAFLSSLALALAALFGALAPSRAHAQATPAPDRPVPAPLGSLRTPESYPLLCRGSEKVSMWVRPVRMAVLIFDKGSGAAPGGLAPGECAWMDRPLSAAEPDRLVHRIPEGADREPPYLWVEALRDPARYWRFEAYNNGRGDLVVTASREQRP